MYTFTQQMMQRARGVRAAMAMEPEVRPDFSAASLATIAVALYVLAQKGVFEPAAMFSYLRDRGMKYDRDVIDFLLNAYEGEDETIHLWMRGALGDYLPVHGSYFE